jgi:hypothetical protein
MGIKVGIVDSDALDEVFRASIHDAEIDIVAANDVTDAKTPRIFSSTTRSWEPQGERASQETPSSPAGRFKVLKEKVGEPSWKARGRYRHRVGRSLQERMPATSPPAPKGHHLRSAKVEDITWS